MIRLLVSVIVVVVAMADGQSLRSVSTQFTTRMFTEVIKTQPGKNVVLSAFSVMSPLAQLALASTGESHDELLHNIGMPNDNRTKAAFSAWNARLESFKDIDLRSANRIYVSNKYNLNKDFEAMSRDVFRSDVKNLNFAENVKSANEINKWVEKQTNDHIKDLVDSSTLNSDTKAVLVNAIYFKGAWKNQFSKQATRNRKFHVTKDKVISVPMMFTKSDFQYTENPELAAQVIKLPYKCEGAYLMIILPNEIDGISELEEKLKDLSIFRTLNYDMQEVEVEVFIPKFKIETTTDLKDVLKHMNVKKIFSPNEARLTKLFDSALDNSDFFVSDAVQKAFIEVNEEGTEAAVANVFGVDLSISSQFKANHPFLFFLYVGDNILFSGAYHGNEV